ncbi:nucleotide-binding protein [Strigomonas culicis]|uniref:Cytosolic Fe-S cluster assembly factor NUBP1 homolog n=1 Tax=Strigomonas culicis TaxID=28005 RepID=S9V169_9TRYP|nr:nucleotide-binding protein [Strigomonas culicis]EPY34758.1 nucleotide-binding protein [Strigomonas culicis]|eukprot:EPY33035.1 nucleotide-binding protein [Strigomonas culicis]
MENANAECVGPTSEQAGIAPSCQGCPNAAICAAAPKGPDPDLPLIRKRLEGVRHKVMVISGKGGVGKSTMTKELAFALGARGVTVGLVDLDICGPSLPRLTGVRGEDAHPSASGIEPVAVDENITVMSMHYLLDDKNEGVLFRGARKNGVIKLFFRDVMWGDVDVLLMDTPPGTSDEHITACSLLRETEGGIDGAVLVTTPQRVAEADVRREVNFCAKAKLPVLGLVENMSGFVCPNCHGESNIFPKEAGPEGRPEGAGARLSREFGVPLWGCVPLDPRLMRSCEEGLALSEYTAQQQLAAADSPTLREMDVIAGRLMEALGLSDG